MNRIYCTNEKKEIEKINEFCKKNRLAKNQFYTAAIKNLLSAIKKNEESALKYIVENGGKK